LGYISPEPQIYTTPRDKFSDMGDSKNQKEINNKQLNIAWDSSDSDDGKGCEILTSMNDEDPDGEDESPTR
jgi:hypothetical protein